MKQIYLGCKIGKTYSLACQYAKTCPTRMAQGDKANGCDKRDESKCATAVKLNWRYPMVHIKAFK